MPPQAERAWFLEEKSEAEDRSEFASLGQIRVLTIQPS
jgi:hypothetical protein